MELKISNPNIHLTLLPQKVIWAKDITSMFLADLHFGKAAHFRKSGLPIPELIHQKDLTVIQYLMETYLPTDFYLLGDLFHSVWNEQWQVLNDFLSQFTSTKFHLILGNHDVLGEKFYSSSIFLIHPEPLELDSLILSHEPMENIPEGKINLCGHIHPGYSLRGKARQIIKIPCFHFKPNQITLPAFGHFTGLMMVKPQSQDKIYGVCEEKIIQIL
jgi:DNA ligase-associated metallophosphoesterase